MIKVFGLKFHNDYEAKVDKHLRVWGLSPRAVRRWFCEFAPGTDWYAHLRWLEAEHGMNPTEAACDIIAAMGECDQAAAEGVTLAEFSARQDAEATAHDAALTKQWEALEDRWWADMGYAEEHAADRRAKAGEGTHELGNDPCGSARADDATENQDNG